MKRRKILKGLTAIPLATVLPFKSLFAGGSSLPGGAKQFTALEELTGAVNPFEAIGVEPIINCRGTFTIIGGSIERPEVRAAMEASSKDFVQYDELADGIGKRLAEITGA
jgi:hypothetical protein